MKKCFFKFTIAIISIFLILICLVKALENENQYSETTRQETRQEIKPPGVHSEPDRHSEVENRRENPIPTVPKTEERQRTPEETTRQNDETRRETLSSPSLRPPPQISQPSNDSPETLQPEKRNEEQKPRDSVNESRAENKPPVSGKTQESSLEEKKQQETRDDSDSEYDSIPEKEYKSEIPLPEISESEVSEFESMTPHRQKEERSYIIRGIISMLLVIAGASMLAIVITGGIKRKKHNNKKL